MMKQPRAKLYLTFKDFFSFFINLFLRKKNFVGPEVRKFEKLLKNYWERDNCITLSTCRLGLYYVLKSLDLKKGSEVLLNPLQIPDFVNVILDLNLKPVFVEIDNNTKSFNLNDLNSKISNKTKVILATYLTGILPDVEKLNEIAEEKKLFLIEDISQSYGSKFGNKKAGSYGFASIGSLSPGKIISSIGGGFILIDSTIHAKKILRYIDQDLKIPSKKTLFSIFSYQLTVALVTSRYLFNFFTYYLFLLISKLFTKKFEKLHRPDYNIGHKDKTIYDNPIIRRKLPKNIFFKFTDLQAELAIKTFQKNLIYGLKHRQKIAKELFNSLDQKVKNMVPIKVKDFEESCFWHFPIVLNSSHKNFQNFLLNEGLDVVGYGLKLCNELDSFNFFKKELKVAKNIHDNTYFLPLFDDMSKNDALKVAKIVNLYFKKFDNSDQVFI